MGLPSDVSRRLETKGHFSTTLSLILLSESYVHMGRIHPRLLDLRSPSGFPLLHSSPASHLNQIECGKVIVEALFALLT